MNSSRCNLGSNSRIPRLVQRGMEITHQDSLLTTTEFIWERAKRSSTLHAEHCVNGNTTGLTGSSFTGQVKIPRRIKPVGVLARALGLWVLNACRVVYVVEEEEPVPRFSFAYGTLPEHAESGEERFQVEWREDDSVWYDILAFSRPNQLFARLAYPYVRRKQKQFARESMLAMKAAVTGSSAENRLRKEAEET